MTKHKIIIELDEEGNIVGLYASGDTEVYMVSEQVKVQLDLDGIFPLSEGYKLFEGKTAKWLKKKNI